MVSLSLLKARRNGEGRGVSLDPSARDSGIKHPNMNLVAKLSQELAQ
jgi:hypothetical protein